MIIGHVYQNWRSPEVQKFFGSPEVRKFRSPVITIEVQKFGSSLEVQKFGSSEVRSLQLKSGSSVIREVG